VHDGSTTKDQEQTTKNFFHYDSIGNVILEAQQAISNAH